MAAGSCPAQTMMPAAIALNPALLRGALKVKVLVPQSSIPGMFVVREEQLPACSSFF